jgi:protein-S-isoprenylcysteine O-methyltransferase
LLTSLAFLFTPHEYYPFAILFAFFEYFFELAFFPSLKGNTFFIVLGSIGLVVGQFFRTSAMWTAGYNFHHLVRDQRDNKHSLTTNGVYSYNFLR